MTIEEKIKYLDTYAYEWPKRKKSLEYQLWELKEKISSARAIQYSDMPKGSIAKSDLSDFIAAAEELEEKIQEIERLQMNRYLVIKNAIAELDNPDESDIIHRKYILGENVKKIAEVKKYSKSQVHRIKKSAIKNIKL